MGCNCHVSLKDYKAKLISGTKPEISVSSYLIDSYRCEHLEEEIGEASLPTFYREMKKAELQGGCNRSQVKRKQWRAEIKAKKDHEVVQ